MKHFILSSLPRALDHAVRMQDGVHPILVHIEVSTTQYKVNLQTTVLCAERAAGDARANSKKRTPLVAVVP